MKNNKYKTPEDFRKALEERVRMSSTRGITKS